MKVSKIILYDEPSVPEIQIGRLERFLIYAFPAEIEIRGSFFEGREEEFFERIAGARIYDLKRPFARHVPTTSEILSAKEGGEVTGDEAALYDGFEFQGIISETTSTDGVLHVVFTNKMICTFDDGDYRYHARAMIGSNPTIISTTGIIEAPAKPRQYYLDLMTNRPEDEDKVRDKYRGEFLERHDSRLSEIVEGYLLQSIVYYETGEAFCNSRECRLFNAHWQKDLLYSQIQNKEFCEKHRQILEKIRRG